MPNSVIQDKVNDQINNEFFSSYSYLAMSAYCEFIQFYGCAKWLRMQSMEEYSHAMRLYDFISSRGGRVLLKPITQPSVEFENLLDVFENVLTQEQTVTAQINSLCELAFKEKAFSALVELEWFIREQVEEEKTARDILHKFKLIGDDPSSLLDLDRELGERTPEDEAK
jgi:ferritin